MLSCGGNQFSLVAEEDEGDAKEGGGTREASGASGSPVPGVLPSTCLARRPGLAPVSSLKKTRYAGKRAGGPSWRAFLAGSGSGAAAVPAATLHRGEGPGRGPTGGGRPGGKAFEWVGSRRSHGTAGQRDGRTVGCTLVHIPRYPTRRRGAGLRFPRCTPSAPARRMAASAVVSQGEPQNAPSGRTLQA